MEELKVKKKGGEVEDFARSKVQGSVMAAGGSQEHAEQVTAGVESWAQTSGPEVSVMGIRSKVLELLRPLNPEAADAYENYKKSE